MNDHVLVNERDRKEIAAAYERGDKIREIEERFGVPRSTIYWILEKEGQTPNRLQRGRRLATDDQHAAQLYAVIEAQERRIELLTEAVKDLVALVPSDVRRRRVAEIKRLLEG